jgi:hypothetical protein
MTPRARLLVGLALFVCPTAIWIYAVLEPSRLYDFGEPVGWTLSLGLHALYAVAGYVARSWFALIFPLSAVVLALPAGTTEQGEFPLVLGVLLHLPGLVAIVGAGVAASRLFERRRTTKIAAQPEYD